MGLSKDKMHSMVISELGGGDSTDTATVTVELTKTQFETAFARTNMWFTSKKGYVIWRPLHVTPTIPEYKMKDDVDQVLDVIFQVPSDVAAFFSLGFFDIIPYGPQSIGNITANTASYSGFAQLLQYNEQRKKVFSVDPDWSYQQQTKILNLVLRQDNVNSTALLKLRLNQFEVSKLGGRDEDLFYRYLLAKCKEIVGRIRSKYDSLPSAGGQVSLDGKTLLEEARSEIELCNVELFASQGPDLAITG